MISPDGTRLAISAGQTVSIVDVHSKSIIATKHMEDSLDFAPCPMAFSPDGQTIAIARHDRLRVKVHEIELCDSRTLQSISVLRGDAAVVTTLCYSPDGSRLAAGGEDGTIIIWDTKTARQRQKAGTFQNTDVKEMAAVAFSPDGTLLGVGGSAVALLLNVETLEVVDKIQGPAPIALAFCATGSFC